MNNWRFTYSKSETVGSVFLRYFLLLGYGATIFYLFLLKGNSIFTVLCGLLLLKLLLSKTVEKESVLVIPAFGVQLQTDYLGRKVIRRFIPIDKILKPVLMERVTPLTCYWSLCLLIREEAELIPIFKELRPPLKRLVPIWEALCAATDNGKEKSLKESTEDTQHK